MGRVRSAPPPASPELIVEPGAVIDGYRVERVLSSVPGRHTIAQAVGRDGARVALKLIGGELAADGEKKRRVLRLAHLRASIAHPHMVRLLLARESDGHLYLVSELPRSRTLADRLSGGPLAPAEAVRIVGQVAGALETAAAQRLLHAELSTAAILLTQDEPSHALLTDFGIGRPPANRQATGGRPARRPELRLDVNGADYRSPEEVRGEPLGRESNVYSLACILLECLTGVPPFPYDRPLLTLHAHLVEAPPLASTRRAGLPPEIDDVLARGMAKEPGSRFPSVAALARAAGEALGIEALVPVEAAPRAESAATEDRREEAAGRRQMAPAKGQPAVRPVDSGARSAERATRTVRPTKRPASAATAALERERKPAVAAAPTLPSERKPAVAAASATPPPTAVPPKRQRRAAGRAARAERAAQARRAAEAKRAARAEHAGGVERSAGAERPGRAEHAGRGERPTEAGRTRRKASAGRTVRPRGRRLGFKPRPASALVAVAFLASAVGGFTIGSSEPAAGPPSARTTAPAEQQHAAAVKLEQAEYVRSLDPAIDRLSAKRAEARKRLLRARRPARQAEAASMLANAYADARAALSGKPADGLDDLHLGARARAAEQAYRRLAAAARTGSSRAWRVASQAAVERERQFERALRTLSAA